MSHPIAFAVMPIVKHFRVEGQFASLVFFFQPIVSLSDNFSLVSGISSSFGTTPGKVSESLLSKMCMEATIETLMELTKSQAIDSRADYKKGDKPPLILLTSDKDLRDQFRNKTIRFASQSTKQTRRLVEKEIAENFNIIQERVGTRKNTSITEVLDETFTAIVLNSSISNEVSSMLLSEEHNSDIYNHLQTVFDEALNHFDLNGILSKVKSVEQLDSAVSQIKIQANDYISEKTSALNMEFLNTNASSVSVALLSNEKIKESFFHFVAKQLDGRLSKR